MSQEFWIAIWLASAVIGAAIGYRSGDVIRGLGAGLVLGPLGLVLLIWFDQMDDRWRESQDRD